MTTTNLPVDLRLPADLILVSAVRSSAASTNSLYFCHGTWRGTPVEGFLKIPDRGKLGKAGSKDNGDVGANERKLLQRIRATDISVPSIITFGEAPGSFIFVSVVPGKTLWDLIDPRKSDYQKEVVLENLRTYGVTLAKIHALAFDWEPQRRLSLEDVMPEDAGADARSQGLVAWLSHNRPTHIQKCFVHGDFNTANLLINNAAVSGVIDWEFGGVGWKEYELAWALRARIHFLDSPAERAAILDGYSSVSSFDESQLRWCEVLNYTHFARWSAESDPVYREFALRRAETIVGRSS